MCFLYIWANLKIYTAAQLLDDQTCENSHGMPTSCPRPVTNGLASATVFQRKAACLDGPLVNHPRWLRQNSRKSSQQKTGKVECHQVYEELYIVVYCWCSQICSSTTKKHHVTSLVKLSCSRFVKDCLKQYSGDYLGDLGPWLYSCADRGICF